MTLLLDFLTLKLQGVMGGLKLIGGRLYTVSQKNDTKLHNFPWLSLGGKGNALYPVPNIDRFSKFFRCYTY